MLGEEPLAERHDPPDHAGSRHRIVLADMGEGRLEMRDRTVGPDEPHTLRERGAGCGAGVPSEAAQSVTA